MRIAVPNLKQFNLSLSPELKKRLEDLAVECEMEKGTKVAADIIKRFVEHWAWVQAQLRDRKNQLEEDIMESLKRPPLVKGEARHIPTAGRKKKP